MVPMSPAAASGPDYGILTNRFLSSKQWDRALATAFEWLGKEPENLQAHLVAAQSLINLDREAEAPTHLARVLAGNPENDFAHRLLSIVHFEGGRFKEADESIRKAISLDPNDEYHWHHLARMSYNQGDLGTAKKCAQKARELNPRDPNIQNLLILCEPDTPETAKTKIIHYEQILELDPENANVYNNMGAQYLEGLKDFAGAEECFRKALFFDPANKMFRRNLFLAIKHRDLVYRTLCAPKDFLFKIIAFFQDIRKKSLALYFLMITIWLLALRFVLGGLILWFTLVWPMIKVYEYLTVGDLRSRAGEVGARRGGLLGYRKWSVRLRLGLFAVCLITFWGMIFWVAATSNSANAKAKPEWVYAVLGFVMLAAGFAFLIYWVRRMIRNQRQAKAARNRARQVKAILEPAGGRSAWWQWFRTGSK
jgi:Flp pilus assembly protein TadD